MSSQEVPLMPTLYFVAALLLKCTVVLFVVDNGALMQCQFWSKLDWCSIKIYFTCEILVFMHQCMVQCLCTDVLVYVHSCNVSVCALV